MLAVFGTIFTTQMSHAATPFNQGDGYEKGAYDLNAIQPTSENWSKHSRFNGPTKPEIKWQFSTKNWITTGLVIGKDGTIYSGFLDGIYAISSKGKVKWQYSLGQGVEARSTPVIGKDGTIYIGASTQFASKDNKVCKLNQCLGGLLAFNPNGKLKWKVTFSEIVNGTPILDKDGNIYIGTGNYYTLDGGLYAVNSKGKIIWSHKNKMYGFQTAPAITKSGYLFAQNNYFKHREFIKDYMGELMTEFSSPVVGPDETLYFGSYTGGFVAMNPDGTAKWEIRLDRTDNKSDGTTYTYGARVSTTAALTRNQQIYTGDENGRLYSIRLTDLTNAPINEKMRQTYDEEADVLDWVLDYHYYHMDDLVSLNNKQNWVRETGSWVNTIVVGQNGTVFVGTEDGLLYSYDPYGKQNWKMNLKDRIGDITIGESGMLYVSVGKKVVAIGNKK